MEGDAVIVGARLEAVGQLEIQGALLPQVGESGGVDVVGIGVDQCVRVEVEQARVRLRRLLPPPVEVRGGGRGVRDLGVVEGVQRVVVDDDAAAARLVLQLRGLLELRAVVGEELVVGGPLAVDERVADEHLAGGGRIDAVVRHRAVDDDGHTIERRLLVRHGRAALGGPMRLGVLVLEQVRGQLFHPRRLDARGVAGEGAGGLDDLRGHHPARRLLRQRRRRVHQELGVAGAGELLALALAHADLRQQAGQQRLVDGIGGGLVALGRPVPTQIGDDLVELADQVLPFAHAHVVQELALAHLAELVAGQLAALVLQVLPQLQVGQEVAGGVLEAGVRLVGLRLLFQWPFTHVLQAQCRDDHGHGLECAIGVGLDQHARQPRVDGDARQFAAGGGQGERAGFGLA